MYVPLFKLFEGIMFYFFCSLLVIFNLLKVPIFPIPNTGSLGPKSLSKILYFLEFLVFIFRFFVPKKTRAPPPSWLKSCVGPCQKFESENGWTERANIFYRITHNPWEGLWPVKALIDGVISFGLMIEGITFIWTNVLLDERSKEL